MESARFIEPAGVGELLLGQLEQDIALQITDAGASSVEMFTGFVEGGSQDECAETASLPSADWSDPVFSVGPTTLDLALADYSLPIENFTFAAAVTDDCDDLRDGVFAGELDARTLVPQLAELVSVDDPDEVCGVMRGFGVSCEACSSDGAEYCISVLIDQLPADGVSWDLDRISASDVSNNPDCD